MRKSFKGSRTYLSSLNFGSGTARPSRYKLWNSKTMELAVSSMLEQGLTPSRILTEQEEDKLVSYSNVPIPENKTPTSL